MARRAIRIPPKPMGQWGDAEKTVLQKYIADLPEGFQGGETEDSDFTGLELLLNHPQLAQAYLPYSNWTLQENELPVRDRELATLRVAKLSDAEYEWAQHVLVALHADVPNEEILRVIEGPDAPGWDENIRLIIKATDELLDISTIRDETYAELEKHYSDHQIMELLFIVGTFHLVALVQNTMGIPLNKKLQQTLKDYYPF